jgi:transposase-like protein
VDQFWPRAGVHYPRSLGEFQSWFRTDADCLDYLDWLRWPYGFICPRCGHPGGRLVADGRYKCVGCGARTSVTAGTLFDRRRTPLTVWFAACWMFATAKDGVSAQHLQRTLEIGSYQTAWAMLHRLRSVLVRPGRERLTGQVEVDEAYFGGEEQGLRGGRAKGKKTLVAIAVEARQPKGIGRCRMAIVTDGSAESLHPFVTGSVEPGTTVITDGWQGYSGIGALGYAHVRRSQRAARAAGEDPGKLLPAVHRVASLAKRWLLGTHQGSVEQPHLASYLDEFTFRFNRRHSRSRGMLFYRVLELAIAHEPVRYRALVANPGLARKVTPVAPGSRGHPPSLERRRAARPWRKAGSR